MKVLINILFPLLISEDSAINLRIDSWKRYDKLKYYEIVPKNKLEIKDLCMVLDPFITKDTTTRFMVGVVLRKFDESILMQIHTENYAPMLINVLYGQIYVLKKKIMKKKHHSS
jgi:hypothetical protein